LEAFEYLARIRDVPSSVSAYISTAINTVSNVFRQSLSENVLYTGKQATTTTFVVLLISLLIFTLNVRLCITSAIAKHHLVKQEMNSKPEVRRLFRSFVGLLPS